MSPQKRKKASLKPPSRAAKTMQYESISNAVYEALETEAWFRRHLVDPSGRGVRKGRASDGSRTRDTLFEEALRWFLKTYERQPPERFEQVQPSWRKTAFWIADGVLARCKAMAERCGVDKRQVMATAFRLYSERLVSDKLVQFRARTYAQARELYREHRSMLSRALRTGKGN